MECLQWPIRCKLVVGNKIICNTEVLKSNLCRYNDAYISLRCLYYTDAVAPTTQVTFKNCAPFIRYIAKLDGTTINDVEDLDLDANV